MARGRPVVPAHVYAHRAAHIIDVAVALRNGQTKNLERMGYTEAQAARLVFRRYRGRLRDYLGDSIVCLFPPANRTEAAHRLVDEHRAPVAVAARAFKPPLDLRTFRRERAKRRRELAATKAHSRG